MFTEIIVISIIWKMDLDTFRKERNNDVHHSFFKFWGKLLTGIVSRNTCVHSVAASSSTPTKSCKIGRSSSIREGLHLSFAHIEHIVFIEAHSPSLCWLVARVVCCISRIDNLNSTISRESSLYRLEIRQPFLLSIKNSEGRFIFLFYINKACKKKRGEVSSLFERNSRGYSPVSVLIAR